MGRILGEVLGRLQTLHLWDGSDFRTIRGNSNGHVLTEDKDNLFHISDALYVDRQLTSSGNYNEYIWYSPSFSSGFYVITAITAVNFGGSCTYLGLSLFSGNVEVLLRYETNVGVNRVVSWDGMVILRPGARIRGLFRGTSAGNSLHMYIHGFVQGG